MTIEFIACAQMPYIHEASQKINQCTCSEVCQFPSSLHGDQIRLKQILINLVKSSIRCMQ